jgi:hypothetical protein
VVMKMFNRSLVVVNNRAETLANEFTKLLALQTKTIFDCLKLLSESGAPAEKIFSLKITHQGLTEQMQQLKVLTVPEAIYALQENIFITVRSMKNNIRPILDSIHASIDADLEEKETEIFKDKALHNLTQALERGGKVRSRASIAATLIARNEPSISLETRLAISLLTTVYRNSLNITDCKEIIDRVESNLEFHWQAMTNANAKFLTTTELTGLANALPATPEQRAAQEVLIWIYKKLIIPDEIEKKIKKLQQELEILIQDINISKKTAHANHLIIDETIVMIQAVLVGMQNSQVQMLETVMNRDTLQQAQTPKKDTTILSNWVKQRDTQFKLSIDDANKQIQEVKNLLHGTSQIKTSFFKRLEKLIHKLPEKKVLPESEMSHLIKKRNKK